jgi:hypothetical protein
MRRPPSHPPYPERGRPARSYAKKKEAGGTPTLRVGSGCRPAFDTSSLQSDTFFVLMTPYD